MDFFRPSYTYLLGMIPLEESVEMLVEIQFKGRTLGVPPHQLQQWIAQQTFAEVKLRIPIPGQTNLVNCLSKFYYFVKLLVDSFGFHTSKIVQLSGL